METLCTIQSSLDLRITISVFHNFKCFQLLKCFAIIKYLGGGLKLTYLQCILWVTTFGVKYWAQNSDYCKSVDVDRPWVGPRCAFTFLRNVNVNGVLTGTWMEGGGSAAYWHYVVIKTLSRLRKSLSVSVPFCWTPSWDTTCGKKPETGGSNSTGQKVKSGL